MESSVFKWNELWWIVVIVVINWEDWALSALLVSKFYNQDLSQLPLQYLILCLPVCELLLVLLARLKRTFLAKLNKIIQLDPCPAGQPVQWLHLVIFSFHTWDYSQTSWLSQFRLYCWSVFGHLTRSNAGFWQTGHIADMLEEAHHVVIAIAVKMDKQTAWHWNSELKIWQKSSETFLCIKKSLIVDYSNYRYYEFTSHHTTSCQCYIYIHIYIHIYALCAGDPCYLTIVGGKLSTFYTFKSTYKSTTTATTAYKSIIATQPVWKALFSINKIDVYVKKLGVERQFGRSFLHSLHQLMSPNLTGKHLKHFLPIEALFTLMAADIKAQHHDVADHFSNVESEPFKHKE